MWKEASLNLTLRLVVALLLPVALARSAEPPLRAVLVGGGPDLEDSGAEIESHVRFAASLLPEGAQRFVLFTDGKAQNKTVTFTDSGQLSLGRRALDLLLPDGDLGPESQSRAPKLEVKIDGAARGEALRRTIRAIAKDTRRAATPLLLYFAGHGSRNHGNREDNFYNMWDDEDLAVTQLAAEIARLPKKTPIALVMVQCFSGAFANVLFRGGDPGKELAEQDVAGFFAATKDRVAAGCDTEIDAPTYQDFSSYFFGALAARNRLGEPVAGADYDGDGVVSLYEAFCFALIYDDTTDVPTCTSDAFLERFVQTPYVELYAAPFAKITAAATPAQRAVLDALSTRLELQGEARLLAAIDRLNFQEHIMRPAVRERRNAGQQKFDELRESALAPLFSQWPVLRWHETKEFAPAAAEATKKMDEQPEVCRALLDTHTTYEKADADCDNEEAFLLRFTRLCASIVRAERLQATGDGKVQERFRKLWAAEQRTLPLTR